MEKTCILCGIKLTQDEVAITDVCEACEQSGLVELLFILG